MMKTEQMRRHVQAAIAAGVSKDSFVERFMGSTAVLAAREWELETLGYYVTVRR